MEFYLDWKFLVFPTTGSLFHAAPHPFISCGTTCNETPVCFLQEIKMKSHWYLFSYTYIKNPKLFWNSPTLKYDAMRTFKKINFETIRGLLFGD